MLDAIDASANTLPKFAGTPYAKFHYGRNFSQLTVNILRKAHLHVKDAQNNHRNLSISFWMFMKILFDLRLHESQICKQRPRKACLWLFVSSLSLGYPELIIVSGGNLQ